MNYLEQCTQVNKFDPTISVLHEDFILRVAQTLAHSSELSFKKIVSQSDLIKLGEFRLANYQTRKAYMMLEIDADGLDPFDKDSMIYAVYMNNDMVASVRLRPYPFEINQFVDEAKLQLFLGQQYHTEYVEWSRLLISDSIKSPRILSALIIYAGLNMLSTTSYHKYLGCSVPLIKRLFAKFDVDNEVLEFNIERRGDHKYFLLKGDFAQGVTNLVRKRFRL